MDQDNAALARPELRRDRLTGEWVIFAPQRLERPTDASLRLERVPATSVDDCPFCPGNEELTPPEVLSLRDDGAPRSDWKLRVVPSKYLALDPELEFRELAGPKLGPAMAGHGRHEIVVETPLHEADLADLSSEQLALVLGTYRRRSELMLSEAQTQYVSIFRNRGPRAGASRSHPHSQLLALPVLPAMVRQRQSLAQEHHAREAECVVCRVVRDELQAGSRVIAKTARYVAFVPYAARFPFEIWLAPRVHQPAFVSCSAGDLEDLAELLRGVLVGMTQQLRRPDYNLLIHSAAKGWETRPELCWWMQIIPRLGPIAGLELATGVHQNVVLPEEAARRLRGGL
jgi:UDPglucose--hexose-1-phosphate uridylyltransferase